MPDRGVRLHGRDLDILLALCKMRRLRTSDLTRLFFDAKGTCQKRLRKLFDAGLVRTFVGDLATENRYALTPLGYALLQKAIDDELPEYRPLPKRANHAHLDLLNQHRIALAKGVQAAGGSLVRFMPHWELSAMDSQAPLVPDAVVVLRLPDGELQFALEVDTGSEPPGIVKKKVGKYAERSLMGASVFGLVSPPVVFVFSSPRRARSISRVLGSWKGVALAVGACPFVLVDGGLRSGFARPEALSVRKGKLVQGDFVLALRKALGLVRGRTAYGQIATSALSANAR